jgi:hypothetical protein
MSGADCNRSENDGRYCPSCKGVHDETLRRAFTGVQRQYEARTRNVKDVPKYRDVDLQTVLRWEQDMVKAAEREQRPFIQRIGSSLYNLETGDSMTSREVVAQDGPYKGRRFMLNLWKETREHEINVQMEYDLVNNEFTGGDWPI